MSVEELAGSEVEEEVAEDFFMALGIRGRV